jgi:hypothetical protein
MVDDARLYEWSRKDLPTSHEIATATSTAHHKKKFDGKAHALSALLSVRAAAIFTSEWE